MTHRPTQPHDQPIKLSDGEIPQINMKVTLIEGLPKDPLFAKMAIGHIERIDGAEIRVTIRGKTKKMLARQLKKTATW